jgi:hypothetical protein
LAQLGHSPQIPIHAVSARRECTGEVICIWIYQDIPHFYLVHVCADMLNKLGFVRCRDCIRGAVCSPNVSQLILVVRTLSPDPAILM